MPRVLHTSILDTTAKRPLSAWKLYFSNVPNPAPLNTIVAERERKENWREEFAWIRVVLTRKKYGRGISAPARTAINHIISVNGACKTREGSASLFALSYNTERSGTRAVVCPIVTTYYVEHVYSRWGASKWRGSWGATGCAATRSSLVSMEWCDYGIWIVRKMDIGLF